MEDSYLVLRKVFDVLYIIYFELLKRRVFEMLEKVVYVFIDGENRCIVLIFGEFYIKLVKFVKNFVYFGVKKNDIVGFSG